MDWEIEDALDRYRDAIDARVCAEIDAGCCQTRRDYEVADQKRTAEGDARDKLEALLGGAA